MSGFNLKMLKCRYIQVWSSYVFKMFNISKIQKKKGIGYNEYAKRYQATVFSLKMKLYWW